MKTKFLIILCSILAPIFGYAEECGPSTKASGSITGFGTEDQPYVIWDEQGLRHLAYKVYSASETYQGLYWALGQDIVLNENLMADQTGATPLQQPIGSEGVFFDGKFLGTFDGRGHTIYGMYMNSETIISGYAGLFGTVKGNGVVKNLNIKDAVIDLSGFSDHNIYVGGIVGYTADNAVVTNCTFEGIIYGNHKSNYQGGIVGYHNSYEPITNCHFSGFIGAKDGAQPYNTSAGYLGGIAGYSSASIENCSVTANITTGDGTYSSYVGGIVGWCNDRVLNCITYGKDAADNQLTIKGKACNYVGGIAGKSNKVTHCRNYAAVQCASQQMKCGGIVGECTQVGYSGNFGRLYCTSGSDILNVDVIYLGGVAGVADGVMCCANYGNIDVPDMNIVTSVKSENVYCAGIVGKTLAMMNSINVGTVREARLFNGGTVQKFQCTYGLSGVSGVNLSGLSHYLNTTSNYGSPSDSSATRVLTDLQSVAELDQLAYNWGMPWGIDIVTKYPLPIYWGGADRDFGLSDITGDGTEDNPYIISSIATFNALNIGLKNSEFGFSGEYFKQVADLDFAGEAFMPLGLYYDSASGTYTTKTFQGHYDGGGHSVRNITFVCDASQDVGFIAQMTGEGTLKNLNFSNVNFTVTGGNVGIALGAYTTTETTARTPLSGINVLACNIEATGDAVAGCVAGRLESTQSGASNITMEGCTVENATVSASHIAGGMVGATASVKISHSTVLCLIKANGSDNGECWLGGLVGANLFVSGVYNTRLNTEYCVVLPTFDWDEWTVSTDKPIYIGGFVGGDKHTEIFKISLGNTMIDYAFNVTGSNVHTGAVIGQIIDNATVSVVPGFVLFPFAERPEKSSDAVYRGNCPSSSSFSFATYTDKVSCFGMRGGWDAYYLNGNSSTGDVKWGYYYPTVSPNPCAVTSANGRYTHYTMRYPLLITAPDKLYVDFTLPAVPLDNNVLTAAEGTSISQILVAAKANLVSHNGVASRLYLHDNMDFKYNGSFQTYAVHFAVENGAKCQVMCLPFEVRQEMLPKGSLMLAIDGYADSAVTSKVIDTAAAGTPFILYNANGVVIDDVSYDGIVTGSTTADTYLKGTFAATTAAAGDYVLSSDGSKFVRITDPDQPIDAFRGYVPAAKFPGAGDEVPFIIEADKFADLTTAGAVYKLNFPLYGVLVHNGVLYATTAVQSADISKPIEGLPMQEFESLYWYDNDQFDWIAIPGLGENYVGKAISTGFVAQYTGNQLANAANYSIAGAAPSINLSTYTSAHILHGNYTNYADTDYHGFFVAPKTNEVARFYGYVTTESDGVRYLTLQEEWCGLLNGKGVVIEGATGAAMPNNDETYQAFEGILVADAAANGGRKILFTDYKGQVTSTLDPATTTDRIYSVDGAVVIEAATDGLATIYTPAGAVVAQQPVTAGHPAVIPLPAGLYIATLPTTATRVVVH